MEMIQINTTKMYMVIRCVLPSHSGIHKHKCNNLIQLIKTFNRITLSTNINFIDIFIKQLLA